MATSRRTLAYLAPPWRDAAAAWDAKAALADRVPADFVNWAPLARDQYAEAHTLMSGYLLGAQGDRAAMAASIEARYPFLDHRVLAFAAGLPARLKLRGLREKRVLKRAFAAELPTSITQRVKQPYRAPDSACFFRGGEPLPWIAELLAPDRVADAGLFDATSVSKLLAKCKAGRAIGFGDNIAFVGIVSTQLLHAQYVRGDGSAVVGA
jgi:asparagine synthase (glutamine-hydrolysing)